MIVVNYIGDTMPGKLWENTRELHHACEEHPVGAAMASGKPQLEWYVGWLEALRVIHSVIDNHMPVSAHRVSELAEDIKACGFFVSIPKSAIDYANSLKEEVDIEGAAYVLTGAHLMGGEIMRRRLEGYPTNHLMWEDRKETLSYLLTLRDREELSEAATKCFKALLDVMDDISENQEKS